MKKDQNNKKDIEEIKKLCRFIVDEEEIIKSAPIEEINRDLKKEGVNVETFMEELTGRIEDINAVDSTNEVRHRNRLAEILENILSWKATHWRIALPLIIVIAGSIYVFQHYTRLVAVGRDRGVDQSNIPFYGHQDQKDLSELNQTVIKLYNEKKYNQALTYKPAMIKLLESSRDLSPREIAKSLNNLAIIYKEIADYQQAKKLYLRALGIQKRHMKAGHGEILTTMYNLGLLYEQTGEFYAAEKMYLELVHLCEQVYGQEHVQTKKWRAKLNEFYQFR